MAWALRLAISGFHAPGDVARVEGEHSLDLMRADMPATLRAITDALDANAHDPMMRWSVVWATGAINHPDTIETLAAAAVAPVVPYDREGGCEQPRDADVLIGVMAVEGLASLADQGSRDATEALQRVLATQPIGVDRA